MIGMDPIGPLLKVLRPLLREHGAKAAYAVGSWARGEADSWSDVDLLIVAPSERPAVERFKDYTPAILASSRRGRWSCLSTRRRSSSACAPRSGPS